MSDETTTACKAADVVPLGDSRRHMVPGGYDSRGEGWYVRERRPGVIHPTCSCAPRLELRCSPLGLLGTVHIHRAWDQRELNERRADV